MASSSSSSVDLHQRIDQILNTNTDMPNFDLTHFVQQIDDLYAHYNDAHLRKKNPIREKLGALPSAAEAANFAEQVSANVKQIGNEIKDYSGDKHQTSIAVLNAIGNVHWIAVGFLVVGAALEIADTIKSNKEECLRLFKSMIDLSKIIPQLKELLGLQKELHTKLNDAIQLIVKGAILCCSQKKRKGLNRVLKAPRDREELQQLSKDIDCMREMLHLQISASILQRMSSPPPLIPTLDNDTVGIEEKIEEVFQLLNWESNSGTTAVVIYGIGGSGKTTLANSVYSSLKDKLQGWKHSRVTLIQNLEEDPKVEKLQSLILEDLTGTKYDVRDSQSGCQILKDIIEKESIFLYIDNALYLEPLRKLLPKDFTNAKKFRLLLTAREANVLGIIESCGVEPCNLYSVGSLPIDAALQVLCKQIDRKRDKDSILEDRPQLRKIAIKCNCCPLFLEVIGAYLHQYKNKVESYDQVFRWLEPGDEFGGTKKYNFDESKVLFSYNGLEPSAKEAFLDICSFFSSRIWEWEEVACIVGEYEMTCLQEGALIKRENEKVKIHDLILLAGQNKSKDNRFRNAKDFSSALKNKELVSQVKGVWIEDMKSPLFISAEELDAMSRSLRVFYLGYTARKLTILKGKCSKQFDELRFLHVECGVSNLPMNIFNLKKLRYLSIKKLEEDVILSPSMNLPSLNLLKLNGSRIHGIAEIAHLRSLKQLELVGCNADGISECFPNLHDLQRLKVCDCEELEELPESLVRLRSLQKLDLRGCMNLKQLPAGFGELVNLTELDLSYCSSLKELPCDLEKLPSLQSLNIGWCSSLLCLPSGLEKLNSLKSLNINSCSSLACLPHGLMSVWGSKIDFDQCSSLSEIPEEICKQTMLTSISLRCCGKLKTLPSSFGELTCLQHLCLGQCESIQKLCNDFHCLVGLKSLVLYNCERLSCLPSGFGKLSALETLDLRDCKSLSSLPLEFGKLSSLKTLYLSGCDKLEELCSDFHCLVALKYLYLSWCNNLRNLPDHFGELGCLERLELSGCSNLVKLSDDFHLLQSLTTLELSGCSNLVKLSDDFHLLQSLTTLELSGCSNLVKLSDDFHLLQSLIRLNLSKCENLGFEWMDCVGNKRSLWHLNIVGSERLIQRWMEMKSEKQRNLVVATKFYDWGESALLLELVLLRVFDEEGLLVGADERPFHSSSLQPQTPLILIIDSKCDGWSFKHTGKNLQQLQRNSKAMQIIYVGTHFKSLNSVSPLRMLAHTPDNSQTSSFFHKLSACSDTPRAAVYHSTDRLEENGLKCTSAWEDISEAEKLVLLSNNIPRDSNFELLKELLVTEETDYLLLNGSSQVKVEALQGKIILLLVTDLCKENYTLAAVKEMYLKLQESDHYVVELVWIPIPEDHTSWEDFERAAANAPWPVVPNPWLMQGRIYSFFGCFLKMPCVCVVDEKGRLIKKDALAMIERWGVEAYPFTEAREEEVRKAGWEGFKVNSSPTLQFLLQNLELLLSKTKEMMDRGAMMFFCVGRPEKMMELAPRLNCALTMLEMDFHVFYVAYDIDSAKKYDMACEKLKENETEKCGITTPSLSDINSFWRRVEYLRKGLMNGVGRDERIVKVRRMVLGLASAHYNYSWGMSIVVVGGDGEMVSGRGMEMVEKLCYGDEESREKLVEEIKKEGVEKSVERRWRDGIIHPKHHPQHPLISLGIEDGINCSLCGTKCWHLNQCNICEKYVICWQCKEQQ